VEVFAAPDMALMRTADGKMFSWGAFGTGTLPPSSFAWDKPNNLVRQGAAPSDFDLDYSSDVLLRNVQTGDVWLWTIRDHAIAQSAGIGNVNPAWQIVGLGDADGDGKADIFWRHAVTGENSVWFMDNRQFKGTIPVPTVPDPNWKIAAIADFNGDGRADILWRNEPAGLFSIWIVGTDDITEKTTYGGVPSNWEIKGAGDMDGDGYADIVWRDRNTGNLAIYRMISTRVYETLFRTGLGEWDVIGVTDIDRDNRADIVFRLKTGTLLARYSWGGQTAFIPAAGPDWDVAAIGDFDGDSHTDVLWTNSAGDLVIWRFVNLAFPAAGGYSRPIGNPGSGWVVVKP
jgi:hypothetical protein